MSYPEPCPTCGLVDHTKDPLWGVPKSGMRRAVWPPDDAPADGELFDEEDA